MTHDNFRNDKLINWKFEIWNEMLPTKQNSKIYLFTNNFNKMDNTLVK